MLVETIFHEHLDGSDHLYWFSFRGDGGIDVQESQHWVNKKHSDCWRECIDVSYAHVDMSPKVTMLQERVRAGLESATTSTHRPRMGAARPPCT